jgi:hypothetical protein
MVGVPYPLWQRAPGLFLSVSRLDGNGEMKWLTSFDHGLNDVDAMGTGCVAITREALEALGRNPFRFDNSEENEDKSEDWIFCADLRAAGFKMACWWDGWYADHVRVVGLAALIEGSIRYETTTPLESGRRQ